MNRQLLSVDLPPLAGSPCLTQGVYGDAGNLELVAPAVDDGFWVFWFNADLVDHRQGAAIGCWSGGLHVFPGHSVQAARITQVQAGPRYLEALALSDGDLHRLHWTPEDGFVPDGVIASDVVDCSAVTEDGITLHVDIARADGTVAHLTGDASAYPAVTWREESSDSAGQWSVRALGLGVDAPAWRDLGAHAITAAPTSLDGGRTDVVLAVRDGLFHLHGAPGSWSEPQRIVSTVWSSDPSVAVHRR